jgi:hypothetical protein
VLSEVRNLYTFLSEKLKGRKRPRPLGLDVMIMHKMNVRGSMCEFRDVWLLVERVCRNYGLCKLTGIF